MEDKEIREEELGLDQDELEEIEESMELEPETDEPDEADETDEEKVEEPEEKAESGEVETKVVKADTEAYGYNYTSLSDIAKGGVRIPKMKIEIIEGHEYILYWDGKEWQQGARIVVPEMKGMNAAQAYGSALTYARRYTTMLAESVVSDDDQNLEKKNPNEDGKKGGEKEDRPASEKALGYLQNLLRRLDIDEKNYKETMERAKASAKECSQFIDAAKKRLGIGDGKNGRN